MAEIYYGMYTPEGNEAVHSALAPHLVDVQSGTVTMDQAYEKVAASLQALARHRSGFPEATDTDVREYVWAAIQKAGRNAEYPLFSVEDDVNNLLETQETLTSTLDTIGEFKRGYQKERGFPLAEACRIQADIHTLLNYLGTKLSELGADDES